MLLGENGAGKTTLLQIATGNIRPDAGTIRLNGEVVQWRSRADALSAGLSVVQQHFSLVSAMTVAENVALSERRLSKRYSPAQSIARVRRIAEAAGLIVDPSAIVGALPVATQQRVEIIKAIAHDAPILLLDEPTAVLSPPEAEDLFRWLRDFVQHGHTVVVITHRIREAMRHGDDVTVLRGGHTTLASPIGTIDEERVLRAILGDTAARNIRKFWPDSHRSSPGAPVLSLQGASVVDGDGISRLGATTLEVRAGEIVAVVGVEGGGQRELLRLLAGRIAPSSGSASLPSTVGFVPEDRLRDAIVPALSLVENMALRGASSRTGIVAWDTLANNTQAAIDTFDVRGATAASLAGNLSGGNQQKFILARELADSPAALIAESPTRGLDVRASEEILDRLRGARDAGTAVVVYSSDVDELLSIADRVVVCYAGSIRETALDADLIGQAMIGAA